MPLKRRCLGVLACGQVGERDSKGYCSVWVLLIRCAEPGLRSLVDLLNTRMKVSRRAVKEKSKGVSNKSFPHE